MARSGLLIVATAPAHPGAAGVGAATHFAARQLVGLGVGAALGGLLGRLGMRRLFALGPALFLAALVIALAVFAPGVGVRAAGARRWVHLGPLSGSPAPFLIGAVALVIAAARDPHARRLATAAALLAVLALVLEPDFSRGGDRARRVALPRLAGGGVEGAGSSPRPGSCSSRSASGRRASEHVDSRIRRLSPRERPPRQGDSRCWRSRTPTRPAAAGGAGLGHGSARHRLSSPASDYAFAVVGEELGPRGALGVVAGWLAIGAGVVLAARAPAARRDPRYLSR